MTSAVVTEVDRPDDECVDWIRQRHSPYDLGSCERRLIINSRHGGHFRPQMEQNEGGIGRTYDWRGCTLLTHCLEKGECMGPTAAMNGGRMAAGWWADQTNDLRAPVIFQLKCRLVDTT